LVGSIVKKWKMRDAMMYAIPRNLMCP